MTRLEQLQQRLSQLAQELHDTQLHYLREALDPYAPPGSRMLVFYTEYSSSTKPPEVEWVITASAGVQANHVLELEHPEALSLLTTLLQTPELGAGPTRAEEGLLLHLNAVTSGAPREERKIWKARTYLFPGKRQAPESPTGITRSRSKSAQRNVTPPKKAKTQPTPTPAPQVQEEVRPSVEAPTLPAPPSENAAPQGQPEEGQSPSPKDHDQPKENAAQPKELPSPEARARVGDIWAALSPLARRPAYFFKVMAVSGDTSHCQRCKPSGELENESTAFTLKAEKLDGTHRDYKLHQRE